MSSTLTRPSLRLRRTLAGALTTALAASTVALLPTSAQAADPAPEPTLTWKISQQFIDHLSSRTLTDGVTFDAANGFTFGGGEGSFNAANGVTTMAYDGTVRGAFAIGTTEYYSVTVSDPVVAVDAAGEGTITAEVSATNGAQGSTPAASTTPARVTVTTFDAAASDWTVTGGLESLTDTPDWDGVLAAGSEAATALGLADGKPVGGKSFAPSFLGQLTTGVRAHFYASGAGSDTKKNPAPFTATAPVPVATITSAAVTQQTPTSLKVAVAGTGYKPGSPGIYISIGETGSTDVIDPSKYLGTVWSGNPGTPDAAVKADGSFSTTLALDAEAIAQLDPTKSYSVITFKAHGQAASDPSQTASAPLAIDFAGFDPLASTPVVSAPASSFGKAAKVTVTVPTVQGAGPTGTVRLTGGGSAQTKALSGGKATFTLSSTLPTGARTLTAAYAGDANYRATSGTTSLTVKKATVSIKDKVTKKPTRKKSGKATVTVTSKVSAHKPGGKVKVYFKKSGQKTVTTSTKTLKSGKATVTVPKLKKKGTWKVYVKYSAGTGYSSVSSKYVGTLKVTK
ncbi:Ig-like domain repeat protein [Aeromicrobium yanjiei]|uniref:Ig-like domain repeat protein n=1 Tax=Aeromicrobium yanjiei TaxID=2662028 RepID=A0A5Q2MD48_9ACTN|nr:Ig-like domain repeat protein [Aeromicrobium yanjiei]QGG40488.1 hypothetical protein GEV26_03390 [Aeromicrobium yanjiei]